MMKLSKLHAIFVVAMLLFSTILHGQQKEYDKLKDLVDRDKLDKAQEYCDKVTASMNPKTAGRFYALMGLAYYNKKDYPKSAENLLKSEDKKTSAKVAKEFENQKNDFYDLKMAGQLYKIAQEYVKAAELLFQQGLYQESAQICSSPDANLKYGRQLFDQGKYDDALHYFKRAKKNDQKFSDEEVLNYYFNKKAYSTAYSILNFGEGHFHREIQGCVIDKMFENNEPMPFVQQFLDSLGIKANQQDEAIIGSLISVKMFDKAESYCLGLKQGNQQIGIAYLAELTKDKYPQISAWANLKSGKASLGKQQVTDYFVETALLYNPKWEKEPIAKKLTDAFNNETKTLTQKCELNYCEFVGFASSMAKTKASEILKENPDKAGEYTKAAVFLKQVEAVYCKKN
jgi:tetratricopeptide (TPR) repeat protein